MFTNPINGTTEFIVKGHNLGTITCNEEIPYSFLETCVDYMFEPVNLNLCYYNGKETVGIIEMNDAFYAYSNHEPILISELALSKEDKVKFVMELLKEALKDFSVDFDGWTMWSVNLEEITPEEMKIVERSFEELLKTTEVSLVNYDSIAEFVASEDVKKSYEEYMKSVTQKQI